MEVTTPPRSGRRRGSNLCGKPAKKKKKKSAWATAIFSQMLVALKLPRAALAFVPFGIVLVRVRVRVRPPLGDLDRAVFIGRFSKALLLRGRPGELFLNK